MNPLVKNVGMAGLGYLIASRVAKKLPGTLFWSLGWGSIASVGTYMLATKVLGRHEDTALAASAGLAAGYLHAYSHQSHFPSKGGPATDASPVALAAGSATTVSGALGARFLGEAASHAPGCRCGGH